MWDGCAKACLGVKMVQGGEAAGGACKGRESERARGQRVKTACEVMAGFGDGRARRARLCKEAGVCRMGVQGAGGCERDVEGAGRCARMV